MKRILVIEDSKILSEIISIQLTNHFNCKVDVLPNADPTIEYIKNKKPDLIVLDYRFNERNLKYQNGIEFLVEFRKESSIPVIIFSGESNSEIIFKITALGANDYVCKEDDDFMKDLIASTFICLPDMQLIC